MDHAAPRISVVIALLNRRATLERCLDSVIGQSYAQRELVVIDGGSTDGSLEVLRARAASIAYWESERDRGLYHAFNKALGKASGDWLYFLGADDYLWERQALEKMAPHLARAAPRHRVVYAQANFVSAAGELLETLGAPWEGFRHRFLQGFMIPHQATFHHRSLFEERGAFDESFRMGGDYELLLRELPGRAPLFVPGVVVAAYCFGGASSAPQNTLEVLRVVRRAQRANGIRFPGLLWYAALARALIRVALWKVLGERTAKRLLDLGRAALGKPAFWTRI
ncbi:MAG TPA: glycosyltransferase family 2 protein [Burkholderiales bacterium]